MNLTIEIKKKIVSAILTQRQNFTGSDAKFATSLGINKAVFARIKQGETEKVLSDNNWISVARKMNVQLGDRPEWHAAETSVFQYITSQLELCQLESLTGIYCDVADIGKTFSAQHYARNHKNAVYVDCSQVKSKQKLVRFIAKEFGLDHNGRYNDVYEDLVYYLKVIHRPLIALDEVADLDYAAFLELKALWNATEHYCAWYMLGADGLQKKIEKGIAGKKVGFTEIFSRYGSKFHAITPRASEERTAFLQDEAATILATNLPTCQDKLKVIIKANGSLRNLYNQVMKIKSNHV